MDLDAKAWPDAQTNDASAFYKVNTESFVNIEVLCLFQVHEVAKMVLWHDYS